MSKQKFEGLELRNESMVWAEIRRWGLLQGRERKLGKGTWFQVGEEISDKSHYYDYILDINLQ